MKHPVTSQTVYDVQSAIEFLQKNTKTFSQFLEDHASQIDEIRALDSTAKQVYVGKVSSALNGLPYNPPSHQIAHQMFFGTNDTCKDEYVGYLKNASKQMKQEVMAKVKASSEIYKNEANDFLSPQGSSTNSATVINTDVAQYFFKMENLDFEPTAYPDPAIEYNTPQLLSSKAKTKVDHEIREVEENDKTINIDQFLSDTLKVLKPWLEKRVGNDIEKIYSEKAAEFETSGQKPTLNKVSGILMSAQTE